MTDDTCNTHADDSTWLQASAYLDTAREWLCERRERAPAQADVWHLRHHWQKQRSHLLEQLLTGQYRLSPMLIVGRGDEQKAMWSAQDALVLKWVALQVAPLLPLHARCEHIKGHGGGPASVARMSEALKVQGYARVLRTDVKGYYANIDKSVLLSQVRVHVTNPVLLALVTQYVHYTVEDGGVFHTPEKGISRSCPLSPLMGALYLHEMDEHFAREAEKGRLYYARYMDDIVILAHSRWGLRKHIRKLNQLLAEKHLRQHPDKTFIGKTEKGFDWMGAWLEPEGATDIAPRAKANHREKVRRLYERAWRWREPKAVTQRRVSNYRWRWTIWAGGLLSFASSATAPVTVVVTDPSADTIRTIALPPMSGAVRLLRGPNNQGTADTLQITFTNSMGYGTPPVYLKTRAYPAAGPGSGFFTYSNGGATDAPGLYPLVRPHNLSLSIQGTGQTTDTSQGWTCDANKQGGRLVSASLQWSTGAMSLAGTLAGACSRVSAPSTNYQQGVIYGTQGSINNQGTAQGQTTNLSLTGTGTAQIVIPAGTPPGTYTQPNGAPFRLVLDNSGTNPPAVILADAYPTSIRVITAVMGCTLSATPSTLDLSGGQTAASTISYSCQLQSGTLGGASLKATLLAEDSSGAAAASTDARQLPVSGTSGYVSGLWGASVPTCPPSGSSAILWDGTGGPSVGTITDASPNLTGAQTLTAKACDFSGVAPGQYSASAVISIVTQ